MAELLLPLLVAPFIGSFLGVVIARLPAGRPVALARSECEKCGRRLSAAELVPLLSYLLLRGKCRGCGAAIGGFHPAIELAATAVALCAVWAGGEAAQVWVNCGLGWCLLALGWIDALHMRLPDVLTLPLIVAGLAATALIAPEDLVGHAIGTVLGYLVFRLLALSFRALRGYEGLGAGDAKLLAAGGAWVGWDGLAAVVLVAAFSGIGWVTVRRKAGHEIGARDALPFGPFLAVGIWAVRLGAGYWLSAVGQG